MTKTKLLPAPAGASPCSPFLRRGDHPTGGPLGDFEAHGDVGQPAIAGYATYNAASQVYALARGGVNIWAKRDEFQYAYRKMKGDFIVAGAGGMGRRRHGSASQDRQSWARSSLDFDSPYVDGALHGEGQVAMQYRKVKGEDTVGRRRCPTRTAAWSSSSNGAATRFIWSTAKFGEPLQQVTQERTWICRKSCTVGPVSFLSQSRCEKKR